MDKLRERETGEQKKTGLFERLLGASKSAKEKRQGDKHALILDLAFFCLGFVFSGRHIIFGARPLGTALVALLPIGVWQTLLGVLVGSLTLGSYGISGALGALATLVLRLILSGSDKVPFSESLKLRMATGLLGGFASAVYGAFALGLNKALLFGAFSIVLPPVFTFMLSGVFALEASPHELLSDTKNLLSLKGKNDKERYSIIFFVLSFLLFLFLISLSLAGYELFGIGFSPLFSGVVTLLLAKRLGALPALAVGFASSLGSMGILSVSFALMGLVSGLAFGLGTGYAVIGGGAALSAWSGYSDGLLGLLSTLPEYSISALIALPLLKSLPTGSDESFKSYGSETDKSARDMVGTMALSFRASRSSGMDALENALSSISSVVRECREDLSAPTKEELEELVLECAEEECSLCESAGVCKSERVFPCKKNARFLAQKLSKGNAIASEDINTDTEFCARSGALAQRISSRASEILRQRHILGSRLSVSLEYSLISRLISEARQNDEAEREIDAPLTASLGTLTEELRLEGAVIRAFGKRRKHIIMALEDGEGKKITSAELKRGIEDTAGVRLGVPEYFRHGKMALMECSAARAFVAECATASLVSGKSEVSGDTVYAGESADDRFFAIISDGMGSGEEASVTSRLCVDFLTPLLGVGATHETVIHLLNTVLKKRAGECSATLDLFCLDLITGEAGFIKSGAAASYIKRGSSVFRIKSHTAPLGVLEGVDAEKIRAEVQNGDLVILLSDGVSGSSEDAPWLLELLASPTPGSLSAFADSILKGAKRNNEDEDDMSVAVVRIREL